MVLTVGLAWMLAARRAWTLEKRGRTRAAGPCGAWTDTDEHGRTRTNTDEHGRTRTNTDEHGRTRTNTDSRGKIDAQPRAAVPHKVSCHRPNRLSQLGADIPREAWLPVAMLAIFALPAALVGMAHIAWWGSLRGWVGVRALQDRGWTLPLGMATLYLPLAYFLLRARVREIPRVLREEQALHPLPAARRVWLLLGPMLGGSTALAAAITLVLVMQEVQATMLLVAPGQETLAIRAMTLLHFAPDGLVAAICLLTLGLMAAGLLAIGLLGGSIRTIWKRSVAHGVGG